MAVAPRTLTRALKRETGMSFGRWRQQFHILTALQGLDQGALVQTVALDLGYEGASAFVTMFRKALGSRPPVIWRSAASPSERRSPQRTSTSQRALARIVGV
jgi:AraC-like DNA-binding protein